MILALKTAGDTSEMYLLDSTASSALAIIRQKKWQAGRALGRSLLSEIEQFLDCRVADAPRKDASPTSLPAESTAGFKPAEKELVTAGLKPAIKGLAVFTGPGSFTGLRIGITTMNTIAYALDIPIVGTTGDDWLADGLARLRAGENDRIVTPHYGKPPNITKP